MSSNMSAGQWVGAIVGAVAGFFTGGATWYATAASMAAGASTGMAVGGMIDPPMGPAIVGPRLGDLSTQSAAYGVVIPRLYGTTAVAGNIFWVENNALKEVATQETQGGKGGGGSEVTTFSYFATFALGLCNGPVVGIRRIWCSGRLIYDAGATDLETAEVTRQLAPGIRLYLGADTQAPDARMQATLGVNNTPAFRGLAYIVFDDFALADYGNSLLGAQFKVEVVKAATYTSAILSEWHAPVSDVNIYYNMAAVSIAGISESTRFIVAQYPGFDYLRVLTLNDDATLRDQKVVSDPNFANFGAQLNYDVSLDEIEFAANLENPSPPLKVLVFGNAIGPLSALYADRYADNFISSSEKGSFGVALTRGWRPTAESDYGDYTRVYDFAGGYVDVPYRVAEQSFVRSLGEKLSFVVIGGANIYKYTPADGWSSYSITQPAGGPIALTDGYVDGGVLVRVYRTVSADLTTGPTYFDRINLSTMARIDDAYSTFPVSSLVHVPWKTYISGQMMTQAGNITSNMSYYPSDVFVVTSSVNSVIPGGESLADIVAAECDLVGLEVSDIDVSTLTDEVRGFRVGAVAAVRSNIDPLQGAFPFDIIQSGYQVRFIRRGLTGSVLAIPETDLAARDDAKLTPRLARSREMDTQLPVSVTINYIDHAREFDTGTQSAERNSANTVNTRAIEMPIVMTATEAAQKAEILLYLYWSERDSFGFSLPPSYGAAEPGDVVTVEAGGSSYDLRLVDVNRQSNGVIVCQARPVASYLSTAVADSGTTVSAAASVAGTTAMELLDIPALSDINASVGYVLALGRYRSGWPGGAAYRSKDAGETWSLVDTTTIPAGMGFAVNALSSPASFGMVDSSSQLTVNMHLTDLSSIGELQMLNGQNHFAYGVAGRWEIIAARTCELQVDGSYILSDLLRGRFGTETHAAQHATGDRLVLLDKNRLKFVAGSLNDIGSAALYRAQTVGAADQSTVRRNFTYNAVNLQPLAPVWLKAHRNTTTQDWTLSWVRRTRVGGEWRDNVDAALGEVAEIYEIDIFAGWQFTTVLFTITGLTSPTATYTAAQQMTYHGYNPEVLYFRIYQISAEVGRGKPLQAGITG